jgi:DNA-binding response OmpR family regulator
MDNKITMLRILLALEDYGELMFLQTVLKKIGFDVDSTQNSRKLGDMLLAMNPDVLVMTAKGKRVKGVDLVPSIKKNRGLPKIILIRTGAMSKDEALKVEGWLDSPVGAPDLLDKIAELNGLDRLVLQEKLLKLRMQDTEIEPGRVLKMNDTPEESLARSQKPAGNFGVLKASTMSAADRQSRYQKFIEDTDVEEAGFNPKSVQADVKELRTQETAADLEEIERQRRAFVEHLFKKKAG